MSDDSAMQAEVSDVAKIEKQYALLPPAWRTIDRLVIQLTEMSLFVIGILFTIAVTLEVVSRYIFNFSIFQVDGAARFLLLWFFLLGAGPALRYGGHVGFELLVKALPFKSQRYLILFTQLLTMVFFLQMVWGGYYSLGPAAAQNEPGLDISLFWAFLAIPVGFATLCYHLLVMMFIEFRYPAAKA
jgi:TRAP-type C4-dicarboxylate transport system permease small subunit